MPLAYERHEISIDAPRRRVEIRQICCDVSVEAGQGAAAEGGFERLFVSRYGAPFRHRLTRQFDMKLQAVGAPSDADRVRWANV